MRQRETWARLAVVVGALVWGVASAWSAEVEPTADVWAVIEENDMFALHNLDHHYTQGLKFVWLSADNRAASWADNWLATAPAPGLETQSRRLGFSFGQNIYTPRKLRLDPPDRNDRPYGGWLYGGMVLQRTGTSFGAIPTLENVEVNLGIVGPASLAEQAQSQVHRWGRRNVPEGWEHQLDTEPGLLIRYGRFWRLVPPFIDPVLFDVVPYAGGTLGNIAIYGAAGATARFGWNLPQDFGPQRIESLGTLSSGNWANFPPVSVYIIGGIEGRAVAHDLFLDGNSFQSSPDIAREPWVADMYFGLSLRISSHFEFTWLNTVRTQQFYEQERQDQFGTVLARLHWEW